jgi:sortase A
MATWRLITPAPADDRGPLPPHAWPAKHRRRRALVWLERFLLVLGIVCLGYYTYVSAETYLYQAYENRELDAILASAPTRTAAPAATVRLRPRPANGEIIGRVEIPRLDVSVVVRAGSDARTLQLAVGHIPGTALPGESGNVGLAGHRDTFFRRLKDIRPDDEIRVATPEGKFVYRVERTVVVEPTDVWVLDPSDTSILTLVTCYPFTYVGTAPQRFIVRASLQPSLKAARDVERRLPSSGPSTPVAVPLSFSKTTG